MVKGSSLSPYKVHISAFSARKTHFWNGLIPNHMEKLGLNKKIDDPISNKVCCCIKIKTIIK